MILQVHIESPFAWRPFISHMKAQEKRAMREVEKREAGNTPAPKRAAKVKVVKMNPSSENKLSWVVVSGETGRVLCFMSSKGCF